MADDIAEQVYDVANQNQIRVHMDDGEACVATANGRFSVAQRDHSHALASCPMHLMLGALGSCIMLTLNAVANHKGILLRHTNLALDYHRNEAGATQFQVTLELDDHLTDRERKILYQSARICEVGKILKGDVQIDYQMSDRCRNDRLNRALDNTRHRAAGGR